MLYDKSTVVKIMAEINYYKILLTVNKPSHLVVIENKPTS